jgi:hypothetical protein
MAATVCIADAAMTSKDGSRIAYDRFGSGRNSVAMPPPFVALMRLMPMWKGLEATAHTLPYDRTALGKHTMYGAPLNADEWASVTVPTLVAYGAKSRAAAGLARARAGAAERGAARASGRQPQRENERAGAPTRRVLHPQDASDRSGARSAK